MKSHVTFSKNQRHGIFLLVAIIVLLQIGYVGVKYTSNRDIYDDFSMNAFIAEVDSLKIEKLKPKVYKKFPFNPNYIDDYKGYSLGMTAQEIDRLHKYRDQNKWVNSTKEFQQVTKISDSLLNVISPFFKFPEWVTKQKAVVSNKEKTFSNSKTIVSVDLNVATASELQTVSGIGEVLSERILKYRNKIGRFSNHIQLTEVYGLKPEVIEKLKPSFPILTPKAIQRINLNTATRDELVTIKYIDYDVAFNIIEQRTLRQGFKSLDELSKVKGVPLNKMEIIKLYLKIQ